ncbi:MAG: hypothetical protein MJZ13_02015 [Bacteroidales bacterium]|nr:hypothetical protein [Bacteroidales bacterium]
MKLSKLTYMVSIVLLTACNINEKVETPIASVGEAVFTRSELIAAFPSSISSVDSAIIADEIVRRWVNQQVMLQKAELNLSDEEIDIENAIEEYRRALIVERYQQKVVDQKFNPEISDADIERYYEQMKENFRLNEAIMKGVMGVIPKDAPEIRTFAKALQFQNDEDYATVEQYLFEFSKNYELALDKWVTVSSLKKFLPLEQQPDDRALQQKKLFEMSDDDNNYYLLVTDIKLADEPAPMEYIKDKIFTVLLNKKKIAFIKQMNADLYNEAMKNNKIKYYYTNE